MIQSTVNHRNLLTNMKIIAINYYTILATEKVSGGIFVATIIPNFGPQIESKIVLSGIMERFPVESEIEMCATLQPNPESPANKDASENRRLSPRSAWRGGPEVWVVGASSHSVTITTPEEVVSEVRDLLGNGYRTITIERQGSPENLSTSGRALKSAPVASGAGRGVCGCGKAAEWTDADQSPVMQAICSVAESEEECRTIEVEPVDLPNTEATQTVTRAMTTQAI